jgi:hypothetical protein
MLDVVLLALVTIVGFGVGITLLALSMASSFTGHVGDRDADWPDLSFDDAIRDHLQLKRRNALFQDADESPFPASASRERARDSEAHEALTAKRASQPVRVASAA